MKKFNLAKLTGVMLAVLMLTTACSSPSTSPSASPSPSATNSESPAASPSPVVSPSPEAKPVKFIIPLWNPSAETVMTELGIVEKVKAQIPNLDVEIEVHKETEYESTMKIRNQSGELPDVFPLQQKWLNTFKDSLAPLDNVAAVANSLYAEENRIDGKILGIPYSRFGEVVYYRKSIFTELGLTTPQTWQEFIDTCKKIKEDGKYIPLILGAKDSWVDYPFNEFMPGIVAKDGDYYSKMAQLPEPFAPELPFYKSYKMIRDLYDAKVMGDDPLGIGFDQSKAMFAAKQGAMIAMGEWLYTDLDAAMNGDTSDISTFILPVRENASDELITLGSVEEFWCINKNAKNPAEAEAFLNFLFDKDLWYSAHINKLNLGPTIKDVTLAAPPAVFAEAFSQPNVKYLIYKAGDEKFNSIRESILFDVKDLGVQMIAKSDLDNLMKSMNEKWKGAQASAK